MIPYLAILAILASPAFAGSHYAFQSDSNLCLGLNADGADFLKVTECHEGLQLDIQIGETQVKRYDAGHEQCLDAGHDFKEGVWPHFTGCTGSASQRFWFTNDGRLALMDQGLCIDAQDFHAESGKPVVLNWCRDGQASQGLTVGHAEGDASVKVNEEEVTAEDAVWANGGPWKIHSALSEDMCIDEYNGVAELRPCDYKTTNPWSLYAGATQVRRGDDKHHRCLTAQVEDGLPLGDGTALHVADCVDGESTQNFWWTEDGRLALTDSGLCVDIPEANAWPGAPLQLWTCGDGVVQQEWALIPHGEVHHEQTSASGGTDENTSLHGGAVATEHTEEEVDDSSANHEGPATHGTASEEETETEHVDEHTYVSGGTGKDTTVNSHPVDSEEHADHTASEEVEDSSANHDGPATHGTSSEETETEHVDEHTYVSGGTGKDTTVNSHPVDSEEHTAHTTTDAEVEDSSANHEGPATHGAEEETETETETETEGDGETGKPGHLRALHEAGAS
jgi:hypothetical protein